MKRMILCLLTACILTAAGCSEPILHSPPDTESRTDSATETDDTTTVTTTASAQTTTTTNATTTSADTTTFSATTAALTTAAIRTTTTATQTTAKVITTAASTQTTAPGFSSPYSGNWYVISVEKDGVKQPISEYYNATVSITMSVLSDHTFAVTACYDGTTQSVSGTWQERSDGTAVFTAAGSTSAAYLNGDTLVMSDGSDKLFLTH